MRLLRYGIYLIIFCLPLYLIRFEIFSIPTTVLELLIYILFISWLITNLRSTIYNLQSLTYKLQVTRLLLPIFLILLGISLATIFSSDLYVSAGIWKAWFIDPLLFFIVLISVIKNNNQIKKVFYSLFLSGAIVSIVALIYLILGKLDPVGRLQAFYDSPNYLAMYLAPALIIGIWGFLKLESKSSKSRPIFFKINDPTANPTIFQTYFLVFSCTTMLLAILLTKSYGAWLGIIVAIGISLFLWLFKTKRRLAWVILLVTVISVGVLGCFALQHKASSLGSRLIIWEKAIQIYKNSPILGIGPGTFKNYFPPYPEWGVLHPHSIYLAFLLQTGIIGFIGFLWLLVQFFQTSIKKLQITKYKTQIISLMAIMTYFLIHGLVDTTYWKNDLSVIFWLVIGLVVILSYLEKE